MDKPILSLPSRPCQGAARQTSGVPPSPSNSRSPVRPASTISPLRRKHLVELLSRASKPNT